MLEKVKNKFRENPIGYVLGFLALLISSTIVAMVMPKETDNSVQLIEEEQPLNFRDLMEEEENQGDYLFGFEKTDAEQAPSLTKRFRDSIHRASLNKASSRDVYANESNDTILALQEHIRQQQALQQKPKRTTAAATAEPKKPSYEELLAKERAYLEAQAAKNKSRSKAVSAADTRASVYRDQYVLPGSQVELVLTEDVVFQGKRYPKGTFLYADISIDGNRVLFDVTNINHIALDLEFRDIKDGRIGLRHDRAGELWNEFEQEASAEGQDGISQDIGQETNSRLVGRSLQALSNFFKRKKLRKHEKIELLNDQELVLKIRAIEE